MEDKKIILYNSKNNKMEHLNINRSKNGLKKDSNIFLIKNESYNNNKIEYENINDIKNENQYKI